MFTAVLLDLDDTLYDRSRAFCALANETARIQLGRVLSVEELAILVDLDERGYRDRRELAAEAELRVGVRFDRDRFAIALAEYVQPEPGVRDVVVRLAANRRVAVVTNGGPAQRVKLQRLELDDVVHAVFVSSEVGVAKPELGIFEQALAWTGRPSCEVLFVGDHPILDIAPAAALGMATAWRSRAAIDWPATLARPTFEIDSVAAVLELCNPERAR